MSSSKKFCNICEQSKDKSLFPPTGAKCLECRNKKEAEKRLVIKQTPVPEGSKECNVCHVTKPLTEFGAKRAKCKVCQRAQEAAHRAEPEVRARDREAEQARRARTAEENRRIAYDQLFQTSVVQIRARTRYMLTQATSKERDGVLDCSPEFLRKWLSFNFTPVMTFDNYGSVWHIDHVIPLEKFDLNDEEQRKMASSWYNCSPYLATDNISKKQSIDHKQLTLHIELLKCTQEYKNGEINSRYFNICATHLDAGTP
jgi:hypothetical protein